MATPLLLQPGERVNVRVDDVRRRLEGVVGSSHVLTDPDLLQSYGKDETHGLPMMMPHAVVHAGSTEEVAAVMRTCVELGVPVTPRGGGTGKSGGCVPVHGGVVLTFGRMNRIQEMNPDDMLAVVQPGVVLGEFQDAVEETGMFYPPDPASWQTCTMGGTVAENAGGPRAHRYGVTRDHVLGLTAVLSSGEVLRVGRRTVKGVAGYDLTALLCGSEGTLAVITEIIVKLTPRPRSVQTALILFPGAVPASAAVSALLHAGIQARTLEYMDGASIAAVRAMASVRLPADAGAALIMETDGDDEASTMDQLVRGAEVAMSHGATDVLVAQDSAQRASIWEARHLLSEATKRIRKHKVSEDVVVPRSRLPEMVARMAELGERHGLGTCSFGHAGDGNLHAQVLFDDPATQGAAAQRCLEDIARAAVDLGGTITGEHGVGWAKRKLLVMEQGQAVVDFQQRLKMLFDPAGILNPGKIFL